MSLLVSGDVYILQWEEKEKEIETEGCNGCSSLQNCSSRVQYHSFELLQIDLFLELVTKSRVFSEARTIVENLLREGKGVSHKNYIDIISIVSLPIEVSIQNFTYRYTCGTHTVYHLLWPAKKSLFPSQETGIFIFYFKFKY